MFSAAFLFSSLLLFSVLALWCFLSCCAPCIPAPSSFSSSCCAFCFRFDLLLGCLRFSSAFLLQRSKGHALQQVPRKGEWERSRSRRRGLQWSQGVKGHLLVSSRYAVTFWSSSCDRWHTSACTCMHKHALAHTHSCIWPQRTLLTFLAGARCWRRCRRRRRVRRVNETDWHTNTTTTT